MVDTMLPLSFPEKLLFEYFTTYQMFRPSIKKRSRNVLLKEILPKQFIRFIFPQQKPDRDTKLHPGPVFCFPVQMEAIFHFNGMTLLQRQYTGKLPA
jgi:hypothetical protein